MVSEARKKALADAFEYTKPKGFDPSFLGWTFYRNGIRFHLWLHSEGYFEANRGELTPMIDNYNHLSLGRLLATKLPPDEMARATLYRLGLLKGDDP